MRRDGVDGAAAVDLAGTDGIVTGAVVDVGDAGHHAFPDAGAAEHDAALVEDLDDVAVLDATGLGVFGLIQHGSYL